MQQAMWSAVLLLGGKMIHDVKKQIWLTKEENELLQVFSQKTCLTEADYIRMLLRNKVPKEKPGAVFYETMNQLSQFSERLQTFTIQLRETGSCDADVLQDEILRWHQFQLDVEKRFLAPEEVPWR